MAATVSCSSSLNSTSASYWNCHPTPSGYSQFRAVAPCYNDHTRTHWTAYGSRVAFSNHTIKSTANCGSSSGGNVRQGNPTIQFR